MEGLQKHCGRRTERWLKAFFPFYNVFFHIKDRNNHFSRYNTFDLLSANVFNMDRSVFFPPICLTAKQVWAGVMKKVVVRQKKGRKERGVRGMVIGGDIQTHDTRNHGRD